MTTVSRGLPPRPHIDVPKSQARELLAQWRSGQRDALGRIRRRHPKFEHADDAAIANVAKATAMPCILVCALQRAACPGEEKGRTNFTTKKPPAFAASASADNVPSADARGKTAGPSLTVLFGCDVR